MRVRSIGDLSLAPDLTRADLREADLRGTNVTVTELATVRSLMDATMPDGKRWDHEDERIERPS